MLHAAELRVGVDAPVVVKRATGPAAASLRCEAERLRRASHPGVVAVLGSRGTDDAWELELRHGGRPVHRLRAATPEHIAGVVAAAATVVADLHDAGVVHGHLDGHHVLLGGHGRVQLCGFGPDAGGATPADDVAALGALLVDLLGDGEDLEPLPEHRWRRRAPWSGWARRSLLTIADQAAAEPPSRRPSARRLAAAILAAVPAAAVPGAGSPAAAGSSDRSQTRHVGAPEADDEHTVEHLADVPADPSRRGPRLGALMGAAATVVVAGAGVVRLVLATPPADPGTPSTTTSAPVSGPACAESDLDAAPGACAERVRVEGTTVVVGERRFQVGQLGDVVQVADWDCDGVATAALLRPATGEVFMFLGWADGEDLSVSPTTVVDGATSLLTLSSSRAGCAELAAQLGDGSVVAIDGEARS